MENYICITCGSQFQESEDVPDSCPICEDERQFVRHGGQKWTTTQMQQELFEIAWQREEEGLFSLWPTRRKAKENDAVEKTSSLGIGRDEGPAGIGQRAFIVQTPEGNLMWDCIGMIDPAIIEWIAEIGGLKAIAVSHPHFHTTMVEWSRVFDNIPVHIHINNTNWIMRPDKTIQTWSGEEKRLFGNLKLVNTGGHFTGSQVLHWPAGAERNGVLLTADEPFVCQDRKSVTFMYSFPNLIPLGPTKIRHIVDRLEPLGYERIYGAFPGQLINSGAKEIVKRSAERYLQMISA